MDRQGQSRTCLVTSPRYLNHEDLICVRPAYFLRLGASWLGTIQTSYDTHRCRSYSFFFFRGTPKGNSFEQVQKRVPHQGAACSNLFPVISRLAYATRKETQNKKRTCLLRGNVRVYICWPKAKGVFFKTVLHLGTNLTSHSSACVTDKTTRACLPYLFCLFL